MASQDLAPSDLARLMAEGNILLIDVREPDEYAVERIDGAVLCPLSTFDARTLPPPGKAKIVFHCGSGIRSAKALAAANAAGLPVAGHLAGGLKAWKQAGLPTNSTGLDTGMSRGKA